MSRVRTAIRLVVAILIAGAAAAAWAAEETPAPKEKAPAGSAAPQTPAADPYVVPDGTPKQLVAYIEKLVASPPRDMVTLKKVKKAILTAADKILAQKPEDKEMETAVQAKMNMLEGSDQLNAFAAELDKGGHALLARQVRAFLLHNNLRQSTSARPEDLKKPIEASLKFLEEAPAEPTDIPLAYATGMMADLSGDKELTATTYNRLAKVFAASKNEKLAEFTAMLQGVVRRLNLVGRDMTIEGKVLGDGAFKWAAYQGHVVLVEFWGIEYDACRREVPDLRGYYDAYHDRGFDIVAVSLDRNVSDVETYVKDSAIPWTTVVGDGKPVAAIRYYGVLKAPTRILVGKDGKVVGVDLTGEELRAQIEKLLGPPEDKKSEKPSGESAK